MYSEIHRHLVLYKNSPDLRQPRFRQIIVVEREHFEVRVLESELVQLDPKVSDDTSSAEIRCHADLQAAVLNAENVYKESVKSGWRAYDPTLPHYVPTGRPQRGFAA